MPSIPRQPINQRPGPALSPVAVVRVSARLAGWTWAQLFMLTLAVWAALLYSGMGSAFGGRPDVAANRLEARVLAQLRQGGASQTARWGRSESSFEQGAKAAAQATLSGPPVQHVPFAVLLPLLAHWLAQAEPQAVPTPLAGLPSRAAPRWYQPLTRAPPPAFSA